MGLSFSVPQFLLPLYNNLNWLSLGLIPRATEHQLSGFYVSPDKPFEFVLGYQLELQTKTRNRAKGLRLTTNEPENRLWVKGCSILEAGDGYALPCVYEGENLLLVPSAEWQIIDDSLLYRTRAMSPADVQRLCREKQLLPRAFLDLNDLLALVLDYVGHGDVNTVYPFQPLFHTAAASLYYHVHLSEHTNDLALQQYATELVVPVLRQALTLQAWEVDTKRGFCVPEVVDCSLLPCRVDKSDSTNWPGLLEEDWLPFAKVATFQVRAATLHEPVAYVPTYPFTRNFQSSVLNGTWIGPDAVFVCLHIITREIKVIKFSQGLFNEPVIWK